MADAAPRRRKGSIGWIGSGWSRFSVVLVAAGAPPPGYSVLGQQIAITAPTATPANPLILFFQIDSAPLTQAGLDYTTVQVLRDGVAIAACDPATGEASPDPCIASRDPLSGTSGARLAIRSSHASSWNFGASRPLCSTTKVTSVNAPFNKSAIAAGRTIWFSGVVKANGLNGTATLKLTSQTITFTANGTSYKLVVPDGQVTFSATATTATTTSAGNSWSSTVPLKLAGNAFISGFGFRVPVNLPGTSVP